MDDIDAHEEEGSNDWDGTFYKNSCSFVSEFGEELLTWLDPDPGERILDVGCGTGELTAKISRRSGHVIGLDPSGDMLAEAREEYPGITFIEADIRRYEVDEPFDAIFSNAVMHWISDHDAVLRSVRRNLKEGGRFVAEFGASGNIRSIREVLYETLRQKGYNPEERDPWYFPEPDKYVDKLEDGGFSVEEWTAFDRPTKMVGDEGLRLWLLMFAERFLEPLTDVERNDVIDEIVSRLRGRLFNEGEWVLDYRRLRFRARKST